MEILNVIESIFVIFASAAVLFGINSWRKSLKEQKKLEIAEETLSVFYELRDTFTWVRHPGFLGYEGETRVTEPGETPEQTKKFNEFYIPIERLNKDKEIFSGLQTLKYRFMSVFGPENAEPFEEMKKIRSKIITSAQMLHLTFKDGKEERRDQKKNIEKWKNTLG